jgi:NADH dehydrogenase
MSAQSPMRERRPHVVVLGAGFGGLTAAKALASAAVRVTVIDRTNHHTFQPLLYQVATAGLSPTEIAQPIRGILGSQRNATVRMAEASGVDLAERRVHLVGGDDIAWDYLIVACGAETSYFGHPDWSACAPGLKSVEDALVIRQRVLEAFERAENEAAGGHPAQPPCFVVIGGGPTGVELAGALAELGRHVLRHEFRAIDPSAAKILLLEAGPRILPSFSDDLSRSAVAQLTDLGVDVRTGARVSAIEPGVVVLEHERLACSVVLWAAGVAANPLTRRLGAPLDSAGRVVVERDLSIAGHPHAFVIGDAARLDGPDGHPLPGVSPVAMQEARTVAKSIRRALRGEAALPFAYVDKGQLATIGRVRAIAMVGRVHLSGFVAWMTWLFVHIFYLIGFKNRVVVMIVWAWSYLTYRRGSRLIVTPRSGLVYRDD